MEQINTNHKADGLPVYKLANKHIYFTLKERDYITYCTLYYKHSNDNYVTLASFHIRHIFCSLKIIQNIYLYKPDIHYTYLLPKITLSNKTIVKRLDMLICYLAGYTNVISYQQSKNNDTLKDYFNNSKIFIEGTPNNSHYGSERQKMYIFEFISNKYKIQNSRNSILFKSRWAITKKKRIAAYNENRYKK